MTIDEIAVEIVKRADEDFSSNEYYLSRARSHFVSAVAYTLLNSETNFSEQEYHSVINVIKLELGVNCVLASEVLGAVRDGQVRPLRLLGGYSLSGGNKKMMIATDVNAFNSLINHHLFPYSDTSYVTMIGRQIVVYPFHENCFLKYIRWIKDDDVVFIGELYNNFSLRFITACKDMAVVGFSGEVIDN